jgi:plastocyanin
MMFKKSNAAARCSLLALVGLVLLVGCSGSSSSITAPSSPGPTGLVTIFITNGVYSPNPLTVSAGQQINWKNNDTIEHSATLAGVFDTGSIPALSAHDVPVTFSSVGTFTFHCSIHAGEVGTVVVQ